MSLTHRPPTSSAPPTPPPLGMGGAGGGFIGFGGSGGFGIGLPPGPLHKEAEIQVEAALPAVAPLKGSAKTYEFVQDKRAAIRGSLLAMMGKNKTTFLAHQAVNAVPVGKGDAFVVAASTGLWEHDTHNLAKIQRLVAEPIHDVAASPDGSHVAYALADGRIRIFSYPDLTSILRFKAPAPNRMRFSADGKRLALGSSSDTVTLIDVAPGAVPKEIDTNEDVNDVFPMPDKRDEVAYASDDDEVVVLNMKTETRVFGSESLVMEWRNAKKPFFVMRDQTAVAYDSMTDTLLAGGDDNMFWRFSHFRTTPKVEAPVELNGNVIEFACCAGRTAADRAAFVSLDTTEVRAISLNGKLGPSFKAASGHYTYRNTRISLLPSGDVLVVPTITVVRWEPRSGTTWQSRDYLAVMPLSSSTDGDTVFVPCDRDGCVVHRVNHGPVAVADVETAIVGELPQCSASNILEFSTGLRAIVVTREGTLQMAYLPANGSLEELINTKVAPGGKWAKRDSSVHGYVDLSGRVYEIAAVPRGMREIGRALGKGDIFSLRWDSATSKWAVRYSEGADVLVP